MTQEKSGNISQHVIIQIIIPLAVAFIVGFFSYRAAIVGVKLSNETNLEIARGNNKVLFESIKNSNISNSSIAEKNNIALLESVEKSNRNNREIAEKTTKMQ